MVNLNITETEEQMTYDEWQAFLRKFEDCTCAPGSALACPTCREYNQRKYGEYQAVEREECTCLPDLPDGRINGGRGGCCPACQVDSDQEIPF